jgi:TatA/E family protein of Tat protein translocase
MRPSKTKATGGASGGIMPNRQAATGLASTARFSRISHMFGSVGMPELLIILTIALIIFGPRKLPELGRSLGRSLQEFKRASNELKSTLDEEIRIEEDRDRRRQQAEVPAQPAATPEEPVVPRQTGRD